MRRFFFTLPKSLSLAVLTKHVKLYARLSQSNEKQAFAYTLIFATSISLRYLKTNG